MSRVKSGRLPGKREGGSPHNYDTFLAKQLSIREIGALGGKNPTDSFGGFPNCLAGYSTTGALVVILLSSSITVSNSVLTFPNNIYIGIPVTV